MPTHSGDHRVGLIGHQPCGRIDEKRYDLDFGDRAVLVVTSELGKIGITRLRLSDHLIISNRSLLHIDAKRFHKSSRQEPVLTAPRRIC